jgi:hypothetical protein
MRHSLFEEAMRAKDFTLESATLQIQTIVRQNAEGLLACKTSSREAEQELLRFLPQLQRFAKDYTEFGGTNGSSQHRNQATLLDNYRANVVPTTFVAKSAEAIEEPIISPELGLKGTVDMLVKAVTSTSNTSANKQPSIMGIELKTCHHQQAQNIHIAQLALYVVMLQARYGTRGKTPDDEITAAAENGLLLYINNDAIRAVPIAPIISEIKSLIGMRNLVAIESVCSTRPRGVRLSYEGSHDSADLCTK